jgi:hypothetical protein
VLAEEFINATAAEFTSKYNPEVLTADVFTVVAPGCSLSKKVCRV